MSWQAKTSCWNETISGPHTGGSEGTLRIVSGRIWLLDLPESSTISNVSLHRGILWKEIDGCMTDEDLGGAKSRARALNEAEQIGEIVGGNPPDYGSLVPPGESGDAGRLFVGLDLVRAWWPGDGDKDIFAHLRSLVPTPVPEDADDIPFPSMDDHRDDGSS
jgi:hypothetical protein